MSTYCFVSGWSSHGTHVLLTIPSIIVTLLYDCKVNKYPAQPPRGGGGQGGTLPRAPAQKGPQSDKRNYNFLIQDCLTENINNSYVSAG
jgi:hypothetical protein